MKTLLSCEFNMDTGCVELRYSDDSMISINCTAVEDEVANSRFQQSELDYLIYNDPVAYADLILNGDPKAYLKNVDGENTSSLKNENAEVRENSSTPIFFFYK